MNGASLADRETRSNRKCEGGKRSFFVEEYKKYTWKNLFDAKLEEEDAARYGSLE